MGETEAEAPEVVYQTHNHYGGFGRWLFAVALVVSITILGVTYKPVPPAPTPLERTDLGCGGMRLNAPSKDFPISMAVDLADRCECTTTGCTLRPKSR